MTLRPAVFGLILTDAALCAALWFLVRTAKLLLGTMRMMDRRIAFLEDAERKRAASGWRVR